MQEVIEEIESLENELDNTTDFLKQMELDEKITDLKIKYNLINLKPNTDEKFECIGCGS